MTTSVTNLAEASAVLEEARAFLAMVRKGCRSRLDPPGWLRPEAGKCLVFLRRRMPSFQKIAGRYPRNRFPDSDDYEIKQWDSIARWLGWIADERTQPKTGFLPKNRQ